MIFNPKQNARRVGAWAFSLIYKTLAGIYPGVGWGVFCPHPRISPLPAKVNVRFISKNDDGECAMSKKDKYIEYLEARESALEEHIEEQEEFIDLLKQALETQARGALVETRLILPGRRYSAAEVHRAVLNARLEQSAFASKKAHQVLDVQQSVYQLFMLCRDISSAALGNKGGNVEVLLELYGRDDTGLAGLLMHKFSELLIKFEEYGFRYEQWITDHVMHHYEGIRRVRTGKDCGEYLREIATWADDTLDRLNAVVAQMTLPGRKRGWSASRTWVAAQLAHWKEHAPDETYEDIFYNRVLPTLTQSELSQRDRHRARSLLDEVNDPARYLSDLTTRWKKRTE
jgi:hypothetical protein